MKLLALNSQKASTAKPVMNIEVLTREPSSRMENSALSLNMIDCGKFIPSGSRQGPFISQASNRLAT